MVTITSHTVSADLGVDMDAEVLAAAAALGWLADAEFGTTDAAWFAAEYLRDVYRDVLRTAGAVDIVSSPVGSLVEVAATWTRHALAAA